MTVQIEKKPCLRCGYCCLQGPCQPEFEDEYGSCRFLSWEGEKAVCGKLLDGTFSLDDPMFNSGCVLRRDAGLFKWYERKYAEAKRRSQKRKG